MSNQLRKIRKSIESPLTRERRAERALLSITHSMNPQELTEFLDSINCPMEEYLSLKEKYSRLLTHYSEELNNDN